MNMLFIADTPKHNRVKTDLNISVKTVNCTTSSNAKVSDRYTKHTRKSSCREMSNQEISDSWGTIIDSQQTFDKGI